MRRLLLIAISATALAGDSNASDQLAFDVQERTDATIYSLQFRRGQTVKTIWSRRVELVNGKKPNDWCGLFKWEQNENGVLVLVETSTLSGKLLQFGSNGDLIAEIGIGYSFLRDGGSQIEFEPPDKIKLINPDGNIAKFMIVDGQLADGKGKIFEQVQAIQIGKPTSKGSAQKPPQTVKQPLLTKLADQEPVPSTAVEKSPGSLRWLVVAVVTPLALLWVVFRKRP